MPAEPPVKGAIAFIDGQNLFPNVRSAFGYTFPNYDVQKLAQTVCASHGWTLSRVQFYTGMPSAADNAFWHTFWTNKLAMMGRRGVAVYSRTAGLSQQDHPGSRLRQSYVPQRRGEGDRRASGSGCAGRGPSPPD